MSFLWRDVAPLVSAARPARRARPNAIGGTLDRAMNHAVARRKVLAGLALGTALAAAGRANCALGADAGDAPKQFVDTLAGKAIAVMSDTAGSDAERVEKFRALFDAAFDLPAIGQLVLGRHWKSATPEQQTQFLDLFEQQEVLIWARRFKSYNGEKLVVESASADPATPSRFRVDSRIDKTSGQPIPLEWQVVQAAGGWRIVDVTIENASMALTLRQDFESVLQSNGGKIDALLAAMQKKIDQLKA
jgi:phospholipid transport system substrate-binding protein